MKVTTIYNYLMTIVLVFFSIACINKENLYQGTKEEQKLSQSSSEYATKFSNFYDVTVNITSGYTGGRFYAIYSEYPYSQEGDIIGKPLLTGLTPITDAVINVPSGVDTLYIVNDEGVKEYPLKSSDITITDNLSRSRSQISRADDTMTEADLEELRRKVNNEYLPEKCNNMQGEELYKCSDLYIHDLEDNQTATVWVTPIKYDFTEGKVWYYTYNKQNPSLSDCTFYGIVNGEVKQVSYLDEISKGKNPLVDLRTTKLNKEFELPTSTFKNNTYVGFVFTGNMGPKFTTPSLNIKENGTYTDANSTEDYVGMELKKSDGTKFTIEHTISSGLFHHFDCLGSWYNVVGLENRLPNQTTSLYDGDYNDVVLLIRSNPETISPLDDITIAKPVLTLYRQGIWIFEDNFPEEGDFDFNDVVVAYSIMKAGSLMDVTCRLVAKGCSNSNEVGLLVLPNTESDAWMSPVDSVKLWDDIMGYFNVYDNDTHTLDFSKGKCPEKCVRLTCADIKKLRPYLRSNGIRISLETYNTADFPYALDIPSFGTNSLNTWFRWSIEGNSIDNAYYFRHDENGNKRAKGWYLNSHIKDETKVVNRTKDMSIW